jgi:hypothetical protein
VEVASHSQADPFGVNGNCTAAAAAQHL